MAATITDYLAGKVVPGEAIWCPFHDDRHRPSARVMPDSGRFWCFACCWGGGRREVMRRLWCDDLPVAVGYQMIDAFLSYSRHLPPGDPAPVIDGRPPPLPVATILPTPRPSIIELMTHLCHLGNKVLAECPPLVERLRHDRGLRDPVALGIGVTTPRIVDDLMQAWSEDDLIAAGVIYPDGRHRLGQRFLLPEIRGGQVVGYQARHQDPDHRYRYLSPPGQPKPTVGWESLDRPGDVWIVEGWFDAAPLWEQRQSAIAVTGLSLSLPRLHELLPRLHRRRVVVVADNEQTTEKRANVERASRRLMDRLRQERIHAVLVTPPDPYKDVSAWAAAIGQDQMLAILQDFVWLEEIP